jgi:hypothetical protein
VGAGLRLEPCTKWSRTVSRNLNALSILSSMLAEDSNYFAERTVSPEEVDRHGAFRHSLLPSIHSEWPFLPKSSPTSAVKVTAASNTLPIIGVSSATQIDYQTIRSITSSQPAVWWEQDVLRVDVHVGIVAEGVCNNSAKQSPIRFRGRGWPSTKPMAKPSSNTTSV